MIFSTLDKAYKNFWVPVFGRILYKFVNIIEGKIPVKKPTYQIKDSHNDQTTDQSKIM